MAVTYYIGTRGLEAQLDPSLIYTNEEFFAEELPANVAWENVTVASEEAMDQWLEAKRQWLAAAWTPNQDPDERQENAQIMKNAMTRMAELEIKDAR